MTWNKAAKQAAARQLMWLPPHPTKVAALTATSSTSTLKQQPWLNRLTEPQLITTDDDMVIDEPVKLVAGPSKHANEPDIIIDGDLMYWVTQQLPAMVDETFH